MRNLLFYILVFFTSSAFSQDYKLKGMILRYEKVTEFIFEESNQKYTAKDSAIFSGAISIDPKKVFIKSYNKNPDKRLIIIETQKEDGTNRDMYLCEMDGKRYAVAISPDKRYLTQIGINDKYIYELTVNNNETEQFEIVNIKNQSNTKEIFTAQSIDEKPTFGDAETFEKGEILFKEFIKSQVKSNSELVAGKCYISIVINKDGKVEDINLLYGKVESFNNAAIEIAKTIPNWKPGKHKGEFVNALFDFEIKK